VVSKSAGDKKCEVMRALRIGTGHAYLAQLSEEDCTGP
jgi:hypothetical protein